MAILDDKLIVWGKYSIACSFCKHYIKGYSCRAFDDIPERIWIGQNRHNKPYPGDKGIRFEPIAKAGMIN